MASKKLKLPAGPAPRVTAQVFLWSKDRRSIRECATGPLPEDLTLFTAPPASRAQARSMLEKAGFTVHEDDLGTALTIEAPETAFQRAFGVGASAEVFPVPPELRELVDTILPVPKPILF